MIITRGYARKLIRSGAADYSAVDDGTPRDSSIKYLERLSMVNDGGKQYVAIIRHDKQRVDHYERVVQS